MARYEYEVTIEGAEAPESNRKKLVVKQVDGSVRILLQGDSEYDAMIVFWGNGDLTLYTGNAKAAGFRPITR